MILIIMEHFSLSNVSVLKRANDAKIPVKCHMLLDNLLQFSFRCHKSGKVDGIYHLYLDFLSPSNSSSRGMRGTRGGGAMNHMWRQNEWLTR